MVEIPVEFRSAIAQFQKWYMVSPNATAILTTPNTAGYATEENFSWVVENLLYFDKTFANDHKLGVTFCNLLKNQEEKIPATSVAGVIIPLSLMV